MALGTAALIISALVSAATTIYSGNKQAKATQAADKKQLGLAMMSREDTLASEKTSNEFKTRELGLATKNVELNKEELGLKKESFAFDKKQKQQESNKVALGNLAGSLDYLSKKDMNMTNFVLSLYRRNPAQRMG